MNKILVIEDDIALKDLYFEIFKGAGFTVGLAGDGEEALLKIQQFKPDIILLDLFIPKINGMDLLKKIKSDSATKNIKVIVSTNIRVDQEELAKNGADYVLIKAEYNPDQLIQKIREILAIQKPEKRE